MRARVRVWGTLCYFWRSFGGLVVVGGCIRCFQRLPPMTGKAVFLSNKSSIFLFSLVFQRFSGSVFPVCSVLRFRSCRGPA